MTDKENDESKPKDGKKSSKQRSEEVASNIVNAINNCPANNSQRRIGLLNLQQINRNSRQIKLETQQEILELLENDEPDENADEMRKRHDRRGYARWYAVILRRNFDLPPRLSGNTYVQNLLAHAKALHAGEHSPGPRPNRKRSNHKSSSAEEPQPKIQATNTNNVQEEAAGLGMEGEEEEERMDMEAATRESRAQIPLYQPRQPSLPTQTQPASMPTRMPEIFVDTQANSSGDFDTSSYLTTGPPNPARPGAAYRPIDNAPTHSGYPGLAFHPSYAQQPAIAQQHQSIASNGILTPLGPNAQPVGLQPPALLMRASSQPLLPQANTVPGNFSSPSNPPMFSNQHPFNYHQPPAPAAGTGHTQTTPSLAETNYNMSPTEWAGFQPLIDYLSLPTSGATDEPQQHANSVDGATDETSQPMQMQEENDYFSQQFSKFK